MIDILVIDILVKYKVRQLVLSAGVASAIALTTLFSQSVLSSNPQSASAFSYADSYRDLKALATDSDLIAIGTFRGEPTYYPEQPPSANGVATASYSTMRFQVREILKEDLPLSNAETLTIEVGQMSYMDGGQLMTPSGIRLFQSGEDYVLFLSKSSADSFYWVSGVTQGVFAIAQDKVNSLNAIEGISTIGPVVQSQPLTAFVADIRRSSSSLSLK